MMNDACSRALGTYSLDAGLEAHITDECRHYFGGYYHVRLMVSVPIPVCKTYFYDVKEFDDAGRRLGAVICFKHLLEKMAVPENEKEQVKRQLLVAFESNLLPYLKRIDFAKNFVLTEFKRALTKSHSRFSR